MMEEIKVGDVFYELEPSITFCKIGSEDYVWGGIQYGEFEVIKVNEKSVRTKNLVEIGCGWGTKTRKEYLLKKHRSKEALLKTMRKRTPQLRKVYGKQLAKYTVKAQEYHVVKLWFYALDRLVEIEKSGLDIGVIEAANKSVGLFAAEVEKKVRKL